MILERVADGKNFIIIINNASKHEYEIHSIEPRSLWEDDLASTVNVYQLTFVDACSDPIDALLLIGKLERDLIEEEVTEKPLEVEAKKIPTQLEILEEIQSTGYNVVTCGNCGEVLLHRSVSLSSHEEAVVKCFSCGEIMDHSDCPDLFTPGSSRGSNDE